VTGSVASARGIVGLADPSSISLITPNVGASPMSWSLVADDADGMLADPNSTPQTAITLRVTGESYRTAALRRAAARRSYLLRLDRTRR
jgi:hypothetical protein